MKYNIALCYDHIFATQTNKALFVSFTERETDGQNPYGIRSR